MRDINVQRVYAGEDIVRDLLDLVNEPGSPNTVLIGQHTLVFPIERRFGSLEEIQQYCDKVLALPKIRKTYKASQRTLKVRKRKGLWYAHLEDSGPHETLAVPLMPWALREIIILHELAHMLSPDVPVPHGIEFRNAFVALVNEVMAPDVGVALTLAWCQVGV